jgi:hypothetical protein
MHDFERFFVIRPKKVCFVRGAGSHNQETMGVCLSFIYCALTLNDFDWLTLIDES